MKKYQRIEIKITEFEVEDVITTSGTVPSQPSNGVTMYSPNYESSNDSKSFGWNWTLWQ